MSDPNAPPQTSSLHDRWNRYQRSSYKATSEEVYPLTSGKPAHRNSPQQTSPVSQDNANHPYVVTQHPRTVQSEAQHPRQDVRNLGLVLQPETRPISQEQLVAEVKGIYAGLVMVEAKCIDVDNKQARDAQEAEPGQQPKLNNEQWQALIALHRTLLHEHHDFFLASQHPSASPALRRLASKYAMPARMWRHGIHSFLELLRHRLPDSLEHMLAFIYLAYSMMALLYETVPTFEDTWIECLGDLGRYRMAIEDDDIRDREVWTGVAKFWYSKAADKSPNVGRLYHHLAILARPNALQQLYYYTRSLSCAQPFLSARESILTLFDTFERMENNSFPEPEKGVGRPLSDDFNIRGLEWAQLYFPSGWFENALVDDEEPTPELASMAANRKERILQLGYRLAQQNRMFDYDGERKQFSVASDLLPRVGVPRTPTSRKYLPGRVNGISVHAIPDTGATRNVISEAFARKHGFPIYYRHRSRTLKFAHGGAAQDGGQVMLHWSFADSPATVYPIEFSVVKGFSHEIAIANPFLRQTETLTKFSYRLRDREHTVDYRRTYSVNSIGDPTQRLNGTLNGMPCAALPDTGAERNIISRKFAEASGLTIDPTETVWLRFGDGSIRQTIGQVTAVWGMEGDWRSDNNEVAFDVLEECAYDVIIGDELLYGRNVFGQYGHCLEDVWGDDEEEWETFYLISVFEGCFGRKRPRFHQGSHAMDDQHSVWNRKNTFETQHRIEVEATLGSDRNSPAWRKEMRRRRKWEEENPPPIPDPAPRVVRNHRGGGPPICTVVPPPRSRGQAVPLQPIGRVRPPARAVVTVRY